MNVCTTASCCLYILQLLYLLLLLDTAAAVLQLLLAVAAAAAVVDHPHLNCVVVDKLQNAPKSVWSSGKAIQNVISTKNWCAINLNIID